MNSNELTSAIRQTHTELSALIDTSLTDGISALHHELLKQKCVALYDLLMQITPGSATTESKPEIISLPEKPIEVPETPVAPPTLFTAPPPVVNDPPPVVIAGPVEQVAPETETSVPAEEKTETEIQNEIIDEIIEQKQEEEKQSYEPVPILKEVINELSLHEKIASTLPPKPDFTEKLSTQITNLKSAINVNLKIAMVNDLFNESSVEYVKAIDKLNSSENIHEAMRFFSELKHTYSWDSDNALVKELEMLVSKRYSA